MNTVLGGYCDYELFNKQLIITIKDEHCSAIGRMGAFEATPVPPRKSQFDFYGRKSTE